MTYLSDLGGTFCRELETEKGAKYPAWVFDANKQLKVETFISENEDCDSVQSLPDIELLFDEIFRRLENIEKAIEEMRAD